MGIEDAAQLALRNLTSIPVLAFVAGVLAMSVLKADLRLPEPVYRVMSFYLLLAIGLKGGVALRESGVSGLLAPAATAVALGVLIPLVAFHSLAVLTRLDRADRGAMAAHYGSTSLVTFTAAMALVTTIGLPFEGHLATLVVILEVPGIIVGLALAQRRPSQRRAPQRRAATRHRALVGAGAPDDGSLEHGRDPEDATSTRPGEAGSDHEPASGWSDALREVLTGPSILLMAGGLVIGVVAGPTGYEPVAPVFTGLFTGVLALFLLHLGAVAGRHLGTIRTAGPGLVFFALAFPIAAGAVGVLAGAAIGMTTAGGAILGVLCASASYIAAPAAVGLALPRANGGLCITSSLGITFPFNLVAGIPLLVALSMAVNPA